MIMAGSTKCPESWTLEYYGYVMANYFSSYKGEYVCVDANMEVRDSASGHNQGRLYSGFETTLSSCSFDLIVIGGT